jgi:soluble lytic murein transglycosylase-like protein
MAVENHLTVRDYFDRALFGGKAGRPAGTAGTASFHGLLSSFGDERREQDSASPTGLTVVDYLKNPVNAKCRFNYRLASAARQKNEATANSATSGSAPVPESAVGQTASAGLQAATQKFRDASGPTSPDSQTSSSESRMIEKSIHRAARRYNLPPGLIRGVIRAESNFQVAAVSRAGAQGLMQLMPETARELGVADPFDIEQNIDGGARYLRQMLDSYGGDVKTALAAYNAGPGAVEKYGGQIPPYQETEQYIDRVLRFSKQMA